MTVKAAIISVYSVYLSQPEKVRNLIKGFLFAAFTYFFIFLLFIFLRAGISRNSTRLMHPYNLSNSKISENISTATIPVLGNVNYANMLKLQQQVIELRRGHHYNVSVAFFNNYYSNIISLMVLSCVGGLLLFSLVSKGWKESSYTLKILFMVITSAAVFISLFTNVFSQQKNFEENMLRYMDYTKTELELAQQLSELSKEDFPQKQKYPGTKDTITTVTDTLKYFRSLDTIIARNNITIKSLTNYILTIDASKMKNMGEVYKELADLQKVVMADTAKSN